MRACLDIVSNVEKIVKGCKRKKKTTLYGVKGLVMKVHLHDHTTGFYLETQKLGFFFLPLRFLGMSNQATLYSCFVLTPSMKNCEEGFSRNCELCRTTLPSCHVKERRYSN